MGNHTKSWHYEPRTQPDAKFDIYYQTPSNYNNNYGINTGNKKIYIAVVTASGNKLITKAHAQLIAAAPELLGALKQLLKNREAIEYATPHLDTKLFINAEKAIAKAEGKA